MKAVYSLSFLTKLPMDYFLANPTKIDLPRQMIDFRIWIFNHTHETHQYYIYSPLFDCFFVWTTAICMHSDPRCRGEQPSSSAGRNPQEYLGNVDRVHWILWRANFSTKRFFLWCREGRFIKCFCQCWWTTGARAERWCQHFKKNRSWSRPYYWICPWEDCPAERFLRATNSSPHTQLPNSEAAPKYDSERWNYKTHWNFNHRRTTWAKSKCSDSRQLFVG